MATTFKRCVEDFTCEHCGTLVEGDGYTNHCPECLWSKHVDVHPGDRLATCEGLMKPVEIIQQGREYLVFHKCVKCTYMKKNKLARNDNMEAVIAIAQRIANTP